jgi:ATP-dependent DNA ligase
MGDWILFHVLLQGLCMMPKKRLNVNWDREVRTEDSNLHPSLILLQQKNVKWRKAKLVVEVAALEHSKKRHLRAPVFPRRRSDKLPEECTIDQMDLAKPKRSI